MEHPGNRWVADSRLCTKSAAVLWQWVLERQLPQSFTPGLRGRDVNRQGMLKILSAADGCADDTIQEAQVPWVSGREIDEILPLLS